MLLYVEDYGNTEPLYYSYHNFTIKEAGIIRSRIDLLHRHLKLDVTVKWEASPPTNTGDFRMTLAGICPTYRFVPEHTLNSLSGQGQTVSIPYRGEGISSVTHQTTANMNVAREVSGTIYTYRQPLRLLIMKMLYSRLNRYQIIINK